MFENPHMHADNILKVVRTNIPLIIKHKRYTYVDVCKHAEVSYRALRNFIDGKTDMALGTVVRVLAAADTTLIGALRWKQK